MWGSSCLGGEDEGTGGMELVASMEAPQEEETGQSIPKLTEPPVPAWLQNLLSPMAVGAGSTHGSCWGYGVPGLEWVWGDG